MSREPISVRGWILDVKGAKHDEITGHGDRPPHAALPVATVWVENTEFASGGIAENGAFIILDVPPINATIGFNAPGAETAKLVLEGVPGTADVFIPDVLLEPNGATVLDPKKILVRLPAEVDKRHAQRQDRQSRPAIPSRSSSRRIAPDDRPPRLSEPAGGSGRWRR